ncbi:MAG: phosphate uptake regulator PhoU [Candidatus Thalassarchaeaceae archaeon]|nr:phosphate uptake regulator PhoU [Candidatus Thalassarchaeaceae archaeon]
MSDASANRSEVRKIQLTGGSTYIVSLPKKWVTDHGLSSKDQVRIEWRPSGTLRVIADASSIKRLRLVNIECNEIPDHMLFDHLVAAYLAGAHKINIKSNKTFSRDQKRIFRKFVRSTSGMEITNELDYEIELISLLNPTEMPFFSSINRMYLLLSSQIRDFSEILRGGDLEILDDADERENEVDALRLLLERQAGEILESASIEDSLGTSRWEAAELCKLVRTLERMGDHSYNLCDLARNYNVPGGINMNSLPVSVIPIWQTSIKLLMANLRKRKISEIHKAKSQLIAARADLMQYEEELRRSDIALEDALFMDKMSESLRRICSYSINVAEILMNIQTHRDSREVYA